MNNIYKNIRNVVELYRDFYFRIDDAYFILKKDFSLVKGYYLRICNSFVIDVKSNERGIGYLLKTNDSEYSFIFKPSNRSDVIFSNKVIARIYRSIKDKLDQIDKDVIQDILEYEGLAFKIPNLTYLSPIQFEYINGASIQELANKYGISKQRVSQKVKAYVMISFCNIKKLYREEMIISSDVKDYIRTITGLEPFKKGYVKFSYYIIPHSIIPNNIYRKKPILVVEFNNDKYILIYTDKNIGDKYFVLKIPNMCMQYSKVSGIKLFILVNHNNNFYYMISNKIHYTRCIDAFQRLC